MPTMRDVAKLAGVSPATVSHVVNNSRRTTPETHAKVEQAINQLGFVPDHAGRSLALRKSGGVARRMGGSTAPNTAAASPAVTVGGAPARGAARPPRSAPFREVSHVSDDVSPKTMLRMLLKIVRAAQPVSRADLARRLGVNRSTVTEAVKPLLARGALRESLAENTDGRIGHPSAGLSLNAEHAVLVGVHIGVRRTQVGLATLDDRTLATDSFDTPGDAEAALTMIRSVIERLCLTTSESQPAVIGVSVPGPTCAKRRRLSYAPHLGWTDIAVADSFGVLFRRGADSHNGVPVVVENDAAAAAVYEAKQRLRAPAGEGWSDFILVRAGTGLGVGLVRGGEVYRGVGAGAGLTGEFGHMTLVAGGKQCACGNRGCWERYASASSASALYAGERMSAGGTHATHFVEIVARAEAGERRAQATLAQVGEYIGIGIGNVVVGLGVPRVVVSGRIVHGWKFIAEPLRETLHRTMAGRLTPIIVQAGEATGAGLGGAIEVAASEYLTSLAS